MASIPQYYSDYIFTNEFSSDLPTPPLTGSDGSSSEMHSEETVPFIDNGVLNVLLPFDSDITSSMSMPSLPERNAVVSDAAVAALFPDHERGLFAISAAEGIATGYHYQHEACDFGEECSGMVSNLWPVYPLTGDNWEIQAGMVQKVEEPTLKIAPYSAEERKDRILRYLKKRSQRNFNKTIKYACRKTLADKRVRVRGRFARNNELCEDETVTVKEDYNFQDSRDPCFNDPVLQMKTHDEEWFQEAISNLMYYHMLPDNVMELP